MGRQLLLHRTHLSPRLRQVHLDRIVFGAQRVALRFGLRLRGFRFHHRCPRLGLVLSERRLGLILR
jgi:hypothetical protein